MKKCQKRTSLKDIAERTGLSVPTVSQILNKRSGNFSSEATKKLVRDTAAELDYKPNFGYKVMLGYKTKTVSILISTQRVKEDEHIQTMIIRLMDEFDGRGYATYISTLGMNLSENIDKINELISRGVEYFVFLGSPVGHLEIDEILEYHRKSSIGYNTHLKKNVESDTCFGFESILRYFLKNDKNNIRLIMNLEGARLQALKNVSHELSEDELRKKYVINNHVPEFAPWNFNESCFRSGYEMTAEILKKEKNINGFIYLSDYFALGGSKCLLEKGYKIGKDVFVAGYNYTNAVRYSQCPISSVEHDIKTISVKLAENVSGKKNFHESVKPFLHIK